MNQIPDSELILNKDGSVYHLNLLPEDIADTIITVGDPDRVKVVSQFFDKLEVRKQKREFITHTGIFNGKRITVISTGIGTDNIDIVFNELDALVNINLETRTVKEQLSQLKVIRMGTSGALQADIEVDSIVFSKMGLGLDGVLNYYQWEQTEEEKSLNENFNKHYMNECRLALPYLVSCSPVLEEKLSRDLIAGVTASCAGFYAPQGRKLRYQLYRPDLINEITAFRQGEFRITNFEMETGALYGLARVLGHHCCSINAIVANRITLKHSSNADRTIEKLALDLLQRITE